jgi:HlyD family secretion protein
VKVVSLTLAETVDASGTLEAQPFASLNWKTGGVVETVYVKPGKMVKKGDILLTLQPDSTSASVASAQADLVTARENLEDTLNSDSNLAQAIIDLKEAQEDYDEKAGYLKYLQTNKRVPLSESYGWYERGMMGGWVYVYKTKNYRGPATEDMLTEAANNLELARADLEDLQNKVDRLKDNDQDILAAQARVDAAQATVNSLSIIAPFDGEVLSVEHRAGDVVSAGELSVNIADLDHLYVEAQVDESDVAKIRAGNQVQVTLDALSGVELSGTVESINPVGEVSSGLIKFSVLIALKPVDDEIIIPLGATADSVIQVREATKILAVPLAAVLNDEQGEYVLVMQSDSSMKRVAVESSSIEGDLVVVTGKLKVGDTLQVVHSSDFKAPNPFGGNK